jgi:ankyrin repeat protein
VGLSGMWTLREGPWEPVRHGDIERPGGAVRHGDLEAVEDFLAIGRDVNAADEKGRTPLHYCVAYWNPDIAELLLEAGANLEALVGTRPSLLQIPFSPDLNANSTMLKTHCFGARLAPTSCFQSNYC